MASILPVSDLRNYNESPKKLYIKASQCILQRMAEVVCSYGL